jgi:hypothetical protein
LHGVELLPEDASGNGRQYGGGAGSEGGNASPKAYAMGKRVTAAFVHFVVVAGVTVNCVDDRWPHLAWMPIVAVSPAAIYVIFQFGGLAKASEDQSAIVNRR